MLTLHSSDRWCWAGTSLLAPQSQQHYATTRAVNETLSNLSHLEHPGGGLLRLWLAAAARRGYVAVKAGRMTQLSGQSQQSSPVVLLPSCFNSTQVPEDPELSLLPPQSCAIEDIAKVLHFTKS